MFTETLHLLLALIPVCYNEFTIGTGYGWTAPILTKLKSTNEYTIEDLSWIGSILEFGRTIGPFIAALFLDKIGRKKILVLCSLIFFISWVCIIFVKSVLWICLARLLYGIGMGMQDTTTSIYLAENYPAEVRGMYCSFLDVFFCLAELVQFIAASGLPYQTTAIVNSSIAFLGLFAAYWLVETPQFLIIKKKFECAEENLFWLRGTSGTPESRVEFEKIKQNVEEEQQKKESYKKLFQARANYKSLIIVFMLNVFTMGTGFAAVSSYMTMIFESYGNFSEYEYTIGFGAVQLVASFIVSGIIERYDRRTLILVAYSLMAIDHAFTAALLYTHENITPVPYYSLLIFATITIYGIIYSIIFPVIHMIRGELFPQSIKAFGGFMAVTIHSTTAFVTARLFLTVAAAYGTHVNFAIYAVISLIAFVYSYFQLPETRGKMLVDIQKNLEK